MDLEIPRVPVWLLFLPERLHGHDTGFVPVFPARPCHWHNLFLQTYVQCCWHNVMGFCQCENAMAVLPRAGKAMAQQSGYPSDTSSILVDVHPYALQTETVLFPQF